MLLFQVKTLLANEMRARYLAKLHMVAGEVNSDSLKKGILYYTLTGMAAESLTEVGDWIQVVCVCVYAPIVFKDVDAGHKSGIITSCLFT